MVENQHIKEQKGIFEKSSYNGNLSSHLLKDRQSPDPLTCLILSQRTSEALLWSLQLPLFVIHTDNREACNMFKPIYNLRASFQTYCPQQVVPYGLCLYLRMYCGLLKLHSFKVTSKWIHHKLRCSENLRDPQERLSGGCRGVRLQGLSVGPASQATMRWASRSECQGGEQQGALRDMNDRDSLKWVGLQLCGCVTLPVPHPTSTQHIWTSMKTTPGALWLPGCGGATREQL